MSESLPARPSLEQLKKLAKDLVRQHEEKQPDALALIGRHLPALAGKSAAEIAAYPFALHDAQSVLARQYGFASWNELRVQVEASPVTTEPNAPEPSVRTTLGTVRAAYELKDYALFCSVMSEQMKAYIPKERFEGVCDRLAIYFKSGCQLDYMGHVQRTGRPVHFWRIWVKGWDSDLLVRMALNHEGLISGLLFSDPFDSGGGTKK
jgi:hypothetical protein